MFEVQKTLSVWWRIDASSNVFAVHLLTQMVAICVPLYLPSFPLFAFRGKMIQAKRLTASVTRAKLLFHFISPVHTHESTHIGQRRLLIVHSNTWIHFATSNHGKPLDRFCPKTKNTCWPCTFFMAEWIERGQQNFFESKGNLILPFTPTDKFNHMFGQRAGARRQFGGKEEPPGLQLVHLSRHFSRLQFAHLHLGRWSNFCCRVFRSPGLFPCKRTFGPPRRGNHHRRHLDQSTSLGSTGNRNNEPCDCSLFVHPSFVFHLQMRHLI